MERSGSPNVQSLHSLRRIGNEPPSRKSFILGTAPSSSGLVLAACGTGTSTGSDGTTVEHSFGTTEIPAEVKSIASVAYGNQDVPLALGVMPAGFAAQTWSVDDNSGMLARTKEKVHELVACGATAPTLFDATNSRRPRRRPGRLFEPDPGRLRRTGQDRPHRGLPGRGLERAAFRCLRHVEKW